MSFARLLTTAGLSLSLLGASTAALAAGSSQRTGWTLTPGVTYNWFDGDQKVDNAAGLRLGLGYQFNDFWELEGVLDGANPSGSDNQPDARMRGVHLDALYDLAPDASWRPYLVFGGGHRQFSRTGGDDNQFLLNAGIGVMHDLSRHLFVRGDARANYAVSERRTGASAMLGIGYRFGMAEAAPASAQAPQPVVAPKPMTKPRPQDSDHDGVPDNRDACPNTPAGAKVDAKGCQIIIKQPVSITLKVQFALNKAVVQPQYFDDISRVAKFMREYPSTATTIEGYTDSTGSKAYNLKLSQRRADAVRKVLIDRYGIDANRLTAKGYGMADPVASNTTAQGRAKNRRVVAVVRAIKKKALTK